MKIIGGFSRSHQESPNEFCYTSDDFESLCLSFYSNHFFRLRLGPRSEGYLEGSYFRKLEPFPEKLQRQETEKSDLFFWGDLLLEMNLDPLSIRLSKTKEFYEDLDFIQLNDGRLRHRVKRKSGDLYFGLGEKSGSLAKNCRRYRGEMMDPMGYDAELSDPLYKHWPYLLCLPNSEVCYAQFYNDTGSHIFDLGSEVHNYDSPYRYFQSSEKSLDIIFLIDRDLPSLTKKYVHWMGGNALMPKYAFGYLASTMSYTESLHPKKDFQNFFYQLEKWDLPADVFHLSSGYSKIENKRNLFFWDENRFGSKSSFIQNFHERGIHLNVNFKPAIFEDHMDYQKLVESNALINDENGGVASAKFWDGMAGLLDFRNEKAKEYWKEGLRENFLSQGFDSVWNDNNEFRKNSVVSCEGAGLLVREMAKASFDVQNEFYENRRPYVLSRSLSPGAQKFAQTWTGDNLTSWKTLKFNHYMGLNMSLSGIFHFGHDVGGFSGPSPEPELFLRWIQYGILMPRFCIHSWNDDGTTNSPWMYPEHMDEVRRLFEFRYQLLPYLYHLNWRAYLFDEPLIRPAFYNEEFSVERILEIQDVLMLGDSLLAFPIFDKGLGELHSQIPAAGKQRLVNRKWWSPQSHEYYEAGQGFSLRNQPGDLPIYFLKEGSMIPWGHHYKTKRALQLTELSFRLTPFQNEGEFEFDFYDDDGASREYENEGHSRINFRVQCSKKEISLEFDAGICSKLGYSNYFLILPPRETRKLRINSEDARELKHSNHDRTICLGVR